MKVTKTEMAAANIPTSKGMRRNLSQLLSGRLLESMGKSFEAENNSPVIGPTRSRQGATCDPEDPDAFESHADENRQRHQDAIADASRNCRAADTRSAAHRCR